MKKISLLIPLFLCFFSIQAQLTKLIETGYYTGYGYKTNYPPVDGNDYYFNYNNFLWKTDGTVAGTKEVHQQAMDELGECFADRLAGIGGKIYFQQCGQVMVVDPANGQVDSLIHKSAFGGANNIISVGDQYCYMDYRYEDKNAFIIKTDGTKKGTIKYDSLFSTSFGIDRNNLFYHQEYFYAGGIGKVFSTKLTKASTTEVASVKGRVTKFIALGNKVVFSTSNDTLSQVWVTDGTLAGTSLVQQFESKQLTLYKAGTSILISVLDKDSQKKIWSDVRGYDFWRTDGTANNTQLMKSLTTTGAPEFLINQNNSILMVHPSETEIWVIDHTTWSINLFKKTINTFPQSCIFKGNIVMAEFDNVNTNLFSISGTTGAKENIFTLKGSPGRFLPGKDFLYFWYNDVDHGMEPWVTDGTTGGTRMIQDVTIGAGSTTATSDLFVTFDNKFLFSAMEDNVNYLWSYLPALTDVHKSLEAAPQNFVIYPNPANNQIQLVDNGKTIDVKLLNLEGKVLLEKNNFTGALDVSAIPGGMYFVKVSSDTYTSVSKLEIVR